MRVVKRALARHAAVVLVGVLALSGCGGNGDTVAPEVWAKSVCGAVRPWAAEIQRLQQETQQRITTKSQVTTAKTELVTLFGNMQSVTDDAVMKVADAGVPDVDEGEKIAGQFVQALANARDSFGTGKKAVEDLPVTDQKAFYDGVVAIGEEMTAENRKAGEAFANLQSAELDKAFNEAPECT